MPRPASLLALAVLAAPPAAQSLRCDPLGARLRPGGSTCVTVRTSPAAPNLTVSASFDANVVAVTPGSATTSALGTASFVVSHRAVALLGTLVTFQASGFQPCSTQIVGDHAPLRLGGEAGSYPGTFRAELTASPAVSPGTFGVIAISLGPGPLPLAVLDPSDPRSLALDAASVQVLPGFSGPFPPPFGRFAAPVFSVPNLGASATLFAHGVTLDPFAPGLFARVSQPAPIRFEPASAFHSRGAAMQTPRSFFPVIENAEGLPLAAGGGQGAVFAQIATKRTEVYDPVVDGYRFGPDLTVARSLHTATELPNGKWLLVGGVDRNNDPTATAELYDPATDRFRAVGAMQTPRAGHTATLLDDGSVLVAGGLTMVSTNVFATIGAALDSTELFRLDATGCGGSFVPGPDMTRPRAGQVAVTLSDGRVLLSGGVGTGLFALPAIWRETELYDPAANTFSSGPSMPTSRAIFPMVQIGTGPDRFLAAGGLSSIIGLGAPTSDADVYTAQPGQGGSWSRAGSMANARGMQAAFRVGDTVVHIGGLAGDLVTPFALGTSEAYDIPTGTWSAGPALSAPRGAAGAYRGPWGAIHVLGGATGTGPNPPVGTDDDWLHP